MNGKPVSEPCVPLERDRRAVMRAWLRKLPERTLTVFIALRVEGKSYAEIAAELDHVSQQIMELAWDGLLNDRIALRLGLSVREVEIRMAAALVALHRAMPK